MHDAGSLQQQQSAIWLISTTAATDIDIDSFTLIWNNAFIL